LCLAGVDGGGTHAGFHGAGGHSAGAPSWLGSVSYWAPVGKKEL